MSKCRLTVMIVVILTLMLPLYGCSSTMGLDGADGVDGLPGEKGDPGDPGLQGSQGEPGPQGEPVIFDVETVARNTIATVSWNTTQYATSQLEYGETTAYGTLTDIDTTLASDHSVDLSGLTMDTTYHFRVRSKNEAGNEGVSRDYTFSTGYHVVFSREKYNITSFYSRDINSSVATIISQISVGNGRFSWAPDLSRMLYEYDGNLGVMDADGSNYVQLASEIPYGNLVAWSPASTNIAYSRMVYLDDPPYQQNELWVADADGSNSIRIGSDIPFVWTTSLPWSPDGTQIVFSGEAVDDDDSEIYVVNADGTDIVQLTDTSVNESYPVWSPDGTSIFYSVYDSETETKDYWVMDVDGSNPLLLADDISKSWTDFSWSPDSSSILYESRVVYSDDPEIWVMAVDGSGSTMILDDSSSNTYPVWSPDGVRIAFVSDESGDNGIWVMNADGSNRMQLSTNYSNYIEPSWSPDSAMIMYVSGNYFYVVNADGSDNSNNYFLYEGDNLIWAP